MKVGEGSVQPNIYDGCYTQQGVKIPKGTWTSPNLRKMLTCQTSFYKVSLIKDDLIK